MKKLVGFLIILVSLSLGILDVNATITDFNSCRAEQSEAISTSGSIAFTHCIVAECFTNNTWSTRFYIPGHQVSCSNGNTNPYRRTISDNCGAFSSTTSCTHNSLAPQRYCGRVIHYDCSRNVDNTIFTPATTTTTTTRTTTTTKTPPTTTKTTTSKSGQTTTTTTTTVSKSDNNYLSSLELIPGEISFSKTTESYSISVNENITNIEVIAIAEDARARVVVNNHQNISVDKPITVVVTAENGSSRTYSVNLRLVGDEISSNALLEDILIEGYNLGFIPDLFSYNLKLKNQTELEIEAIAQDENATVQVIGNSNLQDKSRIEIIVTAEDGTEAIYIINVQKGGNIAGVLIVIVMLGIAGFVGFKVVRQFLGNKKEGATHYEYE